MRRFCRAQNGQKSQFQPQFPYSVLCGVFRHEKTQQRFERVRNRVEKDDFLFILRYIHHSQPSLELFRGLIYGIVTLNSSRLEAVYKMRAKSIMGKLCDDGTLDPSTGLQEISIEGGETLWAAPFLIPKNYVSKSYFHKEIRGVIVFEEITRSWLELYSTMRARFPQRKSALYSFFRILESRRLANDPEALFIVNYEGKIMDSPSVHHSMKSFLAWAKQGHLPAGCNTVSRWIES